jgi:hypothetical protein
LEETNYKGNCFDIAQKSHKKYNLDYCEGFLTLGDEPIYHGFNVKKNKIIDYTVKKHLSDYKSMNLGKLPSDYCGIKIPNKFIESENSKYINDDSINIPPLLYRYFKSNQTLAAS